MALQALQTMEAEPVLDLHIVDKKIEHPEVFITWCLGRKFLADRIRNDTVDPVCLLIQLTQEGPDGTRKEKRIFIPYADKNLGRIIRFPAPGAWDVRAILVTVNTWNRRYSPFKSIEYGFMNGEPNDYYHRLNEKNPIVSETDTWNERFHKSVIYSVSLMSSFKAKYSGETSIEVIIPQGSFGKPLPKRLDTWVRLYDHKKVSDECAIRRRVPIALTFQPIFFLFWEGLKRSVTLLRGLWLMLFGGKPGLSIMSRAFMPELRFTYPSMDIHDAKKKKSWYRGGRILLHPISLFILAGIIMTPVRIYSSNPEVFFSLLSTIGSFTMGLVLLIGVIALASLTITRMENKKSSPKAIARKARIQQEHKMNEQKEQQQREERALAVIEGRGEMPLAVCSVDLDPIKRAQEIKKKSFLLQVADFKRAVCRPLE